MAQPPGYTPAADFSADELANVGGRSTVRTAALDAELAAIETTLDATLANLSLIQRDDGQIRDQMVKLHTLAPEVSKFVTAAGGAIKGPWVTLTVYFEKDVVTQGGNTYIAAVGHTAGVFATDLAANKWLLMPLGAVTNAAGVAFTPTATITSANVQAAIQEVESDAGALIAATGAAAAAAGASAALADLANSSDAAKNDALVAVKRTETGATATTQHLVNQARPIYVTTDFGALTDGSDTGPQIRAADAAAAAAGRPLYFPAGTYTVAADPASPLALGFRTYCLKPSSNAIWIFEQGATIKLAAGAQSWCRVVSTEGCSGLRFYGTLKVDGNVSNISATNNEQMHGVFIFNTTDSYFEGIEAFNTRGDGTFIGGTSEVTFGSNVIIGRIKNKTCGRKPLTLHYCDALTIGVADLENKDGGAALYGGVADTTDKHCLDVEPDSFTGSKRFEQTIGRLRTYGLGNDLTAGTTPTHGDNWILNIGTADCVQSGSSATVPAWEQNAITVNVGTLNITGCAGHDAAVKVNYAARLIGNSLTVTGATATSSGLLIQAQMSSADANKPIIRFNHARIVNSVGLGMNLRSAECEFGTLDATCAAGAFVVGESVSTASSRGGLKIGHLITRDTGVASTGNTWEVTSYALTGYPVHIDKQTVIDSRGTKVGFIAKIGSGGAQGVYIGNLVNPETIPVATWVSTDTYYRVAGAGFAGSSAQGPGLFVCNGTPVGVIPAMIGSLCMRRDGGAATSLYVKESGTGTAGWVAK